MVERVGSIGKRSTTRRKDSRKEEVEGVHLISLSRYSTFLFLLLRTKSIRTTKWMIGHQWLFHQGVIIRVLEIEVGARVAYVIL